MALIHCESEKLKHAVFQLILSSRGSCRPSEGSPRACANFFFIKFNLTLICHLSDQVAFFVRSLTRDLSLIWHTDMKVQIKFILIRKRKNFKHFFISILLSGSMGNSRKYPYHTSTMDRPKLTPPAPRSSNFQNALFPQGIHSCLFPVEIPDLNPSHAFKLPISVSHTFGFPVQRTLLALRIPRGHPWYGVDIFWNDPVTNNFCSLAQSTIF